MQKFKNCGKQGHTYKVCRAPSGGATATKAPKKTPPRRQQNYLEESEDQPFGLFTVRDKGDPSILVDLIINGTPITMTFDTGASISIIPEKTYQTQLPQLQLHKSQLLLRTYTEEPLKICGEAQVRVTYKDQQHNLSLVMVGGSSPPLLGRNWLQQIKLDWKEIIIVTTYLKSLL